MVNLLKYFVFRHARKRPVRTLLGAASIALGVAMFVSMEIAQSSARRAFEKTADHLAGLAKFQVAPADAEALRKIDALKIPAAPVIQTTTTLPELKEGTILVMGVAFAREAKFRPYTFALDKSTSSLGLMATLAFGDGAVVMRRFADRHHLKPGDTFVMNTHRGRRTITVCGTIADEGPAEVFGGNLMILSIATAQRLFRESGAFDRIELLDASAAGRVRAALGPRYDVTPVPRESPVLDDALRNLKALLAVSVVALMVGLFIIYNSVSISVVERVKEIGILRSLGATRGQILSALLLEWGAIGLAGSVGGAAFGWVLARALLNVMVSNLNTMIAVVEVRDAPFEPRAAAVAVALGTATALAAALRPSLEAMRLAPIETLRGGIYGVRLGVRYRKHFVVGVLLMAACFVTLHFFYLKLPVYVGLAPALVLFFGAILVIPQAMIWTSGAMRGVLRRLFRIEGYLAADNIIKFPQRTALTVGALGGALGMMISTASMIEAFNRSGRRWMEEGFPFDVTISSTNLASGSLYSAAAFPEGLLGEVRGLPEVEQAYGVKVALADFRGHTVMIIAVDAREYAGMQRARGSSAFFNTIDDEAVISKLTRGEGVFVSENFARLYDVATGGRVELRTAEGPRGFGVVRVVEDYSWPTGVILMDLAAYRGAWRDASLTYVDVRLRRGVSKADGRAAIARALGGRFDAFLFDIEELKAIGEKALNQSVPIVRAQILIAMVIGFLGIVNTLLISVLRRTREIGLLRAVGMTRTQVARTVVIESVFMALVSGLMGVATGMVGAAYPMRYHTLQLTGFFMPVVWPWAQIGMSMAVAAAIGFVASLIPARRAARVNVLDAIGYE